MGNIDIEYVISAVGMTKIFSQMIMKNDAFNSIIKEKIKFITDITKSNIKKGCTKTNPSFGGLYNAFTEQSFVDKLKIYDNINLDSIYSDSGGLQIVTAGKTVTDEIKNKIYETQTYSNYAMCFDVIPLENTSKVKVSNERSNTQNKIFNQSKHTESGLLTGKNIKSQIQYFRENNAKTKVIIIVQGNNPDDMVDYYTQIHNTLSDDDFNYVGGIAIADTCMGNKELETIDMLVAAKKISKIAHPSVLQQLHLLGFGSVSRMTPVMYLFNSQFLSEYKKLSYDSSSHTSTFMFGSMKLNGTCKRLGTYRNRKLEYYVRDMYKTYESVFNDVGDVEWYINNVFFDTDDKWGGSVISENIKCDDTKISVGACVTQYMYSLYQVLNFSICMDKLANGDIIGDRSEMNMRAIESLKNVKTEYDMQQWMNLNRAYLSSNRIKRKENTFNIEDFML